MKAESNEYQVRNDNRRSAAAFLIYSPEFVITC